MDVLKGKCIIERFFQCTIWKDVTEDIISYVSRMKYVSVPFRTISYITHDIRSLLKTFTLTRKLDGVAPLVSHPPQVNFTPHLCQPLHRAPATLDSYPEKDLPGGISS